MKLFVGLGNPGSKYARNRHNIGFMALERIAERHRLSAWRKRFQGLACDGTIDGERVLLLKPETYMNESGRAVGEAARFLKIPVSDIIVFHDELDLPPGKLKVKTGGGNAGHNGLRSITAHLQNEYVRVRIGIGHPGRKEQVAGYVLHDFSKADQDWIGPLNDAVADAAGWLAKGDTARFQTEIARALGDVSAKPKAQPAGSANQRPQVGGPRGGGTQTGSASSKPSRPSQRDLARGSARGNDAQATALGDRLKRWLDRNRDS